MLTKKGGFTVLFNLYESFKTFVHSCINLIPMTTLLELWRANKEFLLSKTYAQIITFSGDGTLKDKNNTSSELREFLTEIPSEKLIQFTKECLSDSFKNSGLALQEAINQYGERLGFSVDHGLYRGKKDAIGHDGIWKLNDGHSFVIEIKTTDAYMINLETVASYSEKLIEQGMIAKGKNSILIVVGREDTGGLESQIRGSRHSKDIRLISIKALTTLLQLKEHVNNAGIHRQINEVLKPVEYTRLDGLIELMFDPSRTYQTEIEEEAIPAAISDEVKPIVIPDKTPRLNKDTRIEKISKKLNISFSKNKKSNSAFFNAEHNTGVISIISKTYPNKQSESFWYGFNPDQKKLLEEYKHAYVAFICGNENTIILLPFNKLDELTENMNKTHKGGEFYWHIKIFKTNGIFEIDQPLARIKRVDITHYLIA